MISRFQFFREKPLPPLRIKDGPAADPTQSGRSSSDVAEHKTILLHPILKFQLVWKQSPSLQRELSVRFLKRTTNSKKPKTTDKILTCGKDRFGTLSVTPDGCKMRVGLTDATTCFIL